MPIIDTERNVVVVRVVYDGPPFSGKTTTVRTLAAGLGVDVATPEERDGRTVFFDWVDYVGGLFEGRQIRCQIVSVPGQNEFATRRRELLELADAVVMVADTRTGRASAAFDMLRGLLAGCRAKDPPVGFVLQANKRDAPDCLTRKEIETELATIAPAAIIETVATTGVGVREAFVFGVRLALDRVRALGSRGQLAEGQPAIDGPADLLTSLRKHGEIEFRSPTTEETAARQVVDPPELAALRPVPPSSSGGGEEFEERCFEPDPMMPGGFIWPPVDGRSLLHEVAQQNLSPRRTIHGDWWASSGGWHCHSNRDSLFVDAETGRRALIDWARLHAAHEVKLSEGRALVLADAGREQVRLWQLVRGSETLHKALLAKADKLPAEPLARELVLAASTLMEARRSLQSPGLRLRCTLQTLAATDFGQPTYAGLLPGLGHDTLEELNGAELVEREMLPILRLFAFERADFEDLLASMRAWCDHHPGVIATTFASIIGKRAWS